MTRRIIILAAGQGKRMRSSLPKVLHHVGGKPLLSHIVQLALLISSERPIVIYGHEGEKIKETFKDYPIEWVEQKTQKGTADAVKCALPFLQPDDEILTLYADVPLISLDTINTLISTTPKKCLGLITAFLEEPLGYGRIKRNAENKVIGIIEEKDASPEEKKIREVNSGIYWASAADLKKWLPKITNDNAQQEFYLTDIIKLAMHDDVAIHTVEPRIAEELLGINDCLQLSQAERFYQKTMAQKLMHQGVTVLDPNRLDIRGDVTIGKEVVIDVNVILEGKMMIGDHCYIGPHTILKDTTLAEQVEIKAFSHIEGASIGAHAQIGPYARIRPETTLAEEVHIGNFVEIKKSQIQKKTKINHLSYIGDAFVGEEVNIGAGTITCNYDGANKHKTVIGNHVHIGSDTQLVAPVKVGDNVTIAAGSTLIHDVPAESGLVLTHKLDMRVRKEWVRPKKPGKER